MGLASGANSLQGSIINSALGSNRVLQSLCNTGILLSEVGYAMASKLDRSVPSAASRIDHIVMDSRNQSKKNKVPNEQKTAVVTGANSGVGYETAKALGRAGYLTILACRNMESGNEAMERLQRQTGLEDRFEVMALDLASLASVREFVDKFKARNCALDILVNNAGLMMCPYGKTKDGIELQFGTNHVGHFALTTGLLECLKRAEDGARVVTVSSMAAYMMPEISYESVELESKYNKTNNYAISKLANQTFTGALAKRLEGTKVAATVLHPGSIATNLTRHVGSSSIQRAAENAVLLDATAGALTSVYVALSPEVEGETGKFYARGLEMSMHPKAVDTAEQDNLWAYTEKLIAEKTKGTLTDIGSAMLSKLDWTTASASSRIDQIIRDSLDHQAEASEQRTAVVTGANSGIGYETAKALGRAGYFTILACRSMELGSEAVERLERETGLAGRFEVMQVDLASLASVRGFVSGIKARGCKVSILVNNGGVACPYMRTTDGIEMQFGTNHVGHFALTLGLLDSGSISRSEARIVIVSSMAAFMVGRMDYRAVSEEARFSSMQNYALSKLANMTFARALAGRLAGSGTTVSVVTPGAVATNLSRHGATHGFERALLRALFVDAPTGAICSIYAALSPE
ncbi:hypothetical protein EV174_005279, partial [Coemansia sp. RSA 2320]